MMRGVSDSVRRITRQASPYADGYAIASIPSPDGRLVAYAWVKRTGVELRIIGTDGSGMRILYSNREFDGAQRSARMATHARHRFEDVSANFVGDSLKLIR